MMYNRSQFSIIHIFKPKLWFMLRYWHMNMAFHSCSGWHENRSRHVSHSSVHLWHIVYHMSRILLPMTLNCTYVLFPVGILWSPASEFPHFQEIPQFIRQDLLSIIDSPVSLTARVQTHESDSISINHTIMAASERKRELWWIHPGYWQQLCLTSNISGPSWVVSMVGLGYKLQIGSRSFTAVSS